MVLIGGLVNLLWPLDGDSRGGNTLVSVNGMDLGGLSAGIGVAVLIYVGLTVALAALGLWLSYTIIWRAVRRGMREFYGGQLDVARSVDTIRRSPGLRDW